MAKTPPRFVYGKDDVLFGSIEEQQGDKPFGLVLDAGTGLHSLRWLATLKGEDGNGGQGDKGMERCIAMTADTTMQRNCEREVEALGRSDLFDIRIGNWFPDKAATKPATKQKALDEELIQELGEEQFDVILADYLIGAMDGFSPYSQDEMIPKLTRLLKPGGRLYIVGLQPIPDKSPDPAANLICQVRQVRDACILLAGHRCYREYPVEWIQRQIKSTQSGAGASLKLLNTSTFAILYRHETIVKQINVARSKFPYFPTKELSTSMATVLDDLEAKTAAAIEKQGRITLGFDYIVTAEKVPATTTTTTAATRGGSSSSSSDQ